MYEYTATISRVVDGDTIDVWIDLGFSVSVFQRVRLAGVDTPESRTRDLREKKFGLLSSYRVKQLLPVGEVFTVSSKSLDSRGKYGRAMLDFHLPTGLTLSETLLKEHLAVAYHGQNKSEVRASHEANWDYLDKMETEQQ